MAGRRRFGTVEKRGDRPGYYVRFYWRGRRYKRAGGDKKRDAERRLANVLTFHDRGWSLEETLSEVFGEVYGPRLTFRAAVDEYLTYAKGRKKKSTFDRDVLRLRRTCKASWTKKPLAEIHSRDIQRWITGLQKPGLAPSTLNRYRAIASAVFKWAMLEGYADENPVKRVEAFSESGREKKIYLTAKEARALVESAEPEFQSVLMTALHTGARKGEILSLRWRDVDFDRKEVVVQAAYSKTKRLRVIPLSDELQVELRAVRETRRTLKVDGSDPIFASSDGSFLGAGKVRGMMRRALKACRTIPDHKKVEVTFHVLRHTFASLAAQNGVTIFELQKILGHKTPAMTSRYSHFYPEAARAAVNRLGKILARKDDKKRQRRSGS